VFPKSAGVEASVLQIVRTALAGCATSRAIRY